MAENTEYNFDVVFEKIEEYKKECDPNYEYVVNYIEQMDSDISVVKEVAESINLAEAIHTYTGS